MTESAMEVVADGLAKVNEATQFLSISRGELYEALRDGTLASVKMNKKRRIPWRELKRYAAERLVTK